MNKVVVAAVLLLMSLPAAAQQGATGELTGRVTTGADALQGVTVTLTSAAIQSPRVTISGENGGYRFSLLPPADYIVRYELHGLSPVESHVHVGLGETVRSDARLPAASLSETVVVRGDARPADAAISANFSAPLLRQLPGAHDIRATTLLAPGANTLGTRGGFVIAGAPSWDSLYIVDGVPASEYLSGQPQDVVIEDAIEEVVVMTGAISAEYGRFTGGVVSTVTKSGGNEFNGSLRDRVTNPSWTAGRTAFDHLNHAVEATAGGYAVRDRLWFFAGVRNAGTTTEQFTSRTNVPYSNVVDDKRWELKLTGQITPRHDVVVSYADASIRERNALDTRSASAVLDLASLIADRSAPTRLFAATYNGIVAPNTAAEAQYSQKTYALAGNGGLSSDRIAGTVIVSNVGLMNAPFGCGICGADERDSKSFAAHLSNYRATRRGDHAIVIGGEAFRERRINAGTRSSSGFNIQAVSASTAGSNVELLSGPLTAIDWTQHDPRDRGSDLGTISGYVNDRWNVTSRLTVNIGLRYDRNRDRDAIGRVISDDAAFSPRLGATFDLGRQQLFASYGNYVARMLEGGGSPQQIGVFTQYGWHYGGPPIEGMPAADALAKMFAWFDSVGGTANRSYLQFVTTPETTNLFHGSLRSPSVNERSVGYGFRAANGLVRADFIARDWNHFYASRIDHTTGQELTEAGTVDVAWVVNDNSQTVRRYRAVQLQGAWHRGRLDVGGGYTWSRLQGNDTEEDAVSAPRNTPLSLWYPEVAGYPERRPFGYLPQDQRHTARLWIAGHASRWTGSLLQRFDSGHPYSAVANLDPKTWASNSGYALTQILSPPYYFGGRGAFRTDNVFSTDVALQYGIGHAFVKADVLNVFNDAAVVAPGTDVVTRGYAPFNPFTTRPVEGVNYALGATFGKAIGPQSYQQPRTYQLAAGVHF